MKLSIMYCLICISLFAGYSIKAQDSSAASRHQQKGDFYQAGLEYEKLAFFAAHEQERCHWAIKAYETYLQQGSYSKAEASLALVQLEELATHQAASIRYRMALSAYLAGNFAAAEGHVLQQRMSQDTIMQEDFRILHLLTLNEQRKWQEAGMLLHAWIHERSDLDTLSKKALHEKADAFYCSKHLPKLKKESVANYYAHFVPGGSYLYTGYYKEGMINAGLQLLCLAGTAYGIYAQYYVTSFVLGYGFFQRFYTGSIKKHQVLVEERNKKTVESFNSEVRFFLKNIKASY